MCEVIRCVLFQLGSLVPVTTETPPTTPSTNDHQQPFMEPSNLLNLPPSVVNHQVIDIINHSTNLVLPLLVCDLIQIAGEQATYYLKNTPPPIPLTNSKVDMIMYRIQVFLLNFKRPILLYCSFKMQSQSKVIICPKENLYLKSTFKLLFYFSC